MRLARLHRRLVSAMALAALVAYAAGDGVTLAVVVAGAALGLSIAWLPPRATGAWIERVTRVGVLALCAWLVYAAALLGQDFMPGVMGMLLFLLGGEALRPLEARNDMRLYSLSFALLIAATAFYPGPAFALGFVAYVGLAVLAMMVGYLRRETERFRAGEARVGRRFLWTTAALSLVTLGMSAGVFVLFPRLPRAWNVQGRRGAGGEMAGFSDRVSIGEFGGRIGANPQVMFRAEFPGGPPPGVEELHWRGRAFEDFEDGVWSRASLTGDLEPEVYARRWGGPFRRIRIFGGPPGADVIFGPPPVLTVQARSAIRVFRGRSGDFFFLGSDNPVYTVWTTDARPSDAELRAGDDSSAAPWNAAVWLPGGIDPRVQRLADSLTAGMTARIDQVRAVEGWLKREFTYTLDLPATSADATLEAFLFSRRQGHCEYFSTAMAVLLRARGIPTRNVNGFLGGEWNEGAGYLAVTGDRAHSWVEVWFPEWGWVSFDPTPPGTAELLDRAARGSWLWAARLWMDGIEYRWHRWVLDYDLDRQLGVFRGIGAFFSQGDRPDAVPRPRGPVRFPARWLLAVVAGGLVVVLARGVRRGRRLPPASRTYLSLRRAYVRAGWTTETGDGPLVFAETLAREQAPGAEDAARAVDLYLRARFGEPGRDDADRDELTRRAASARAAVRRTRRRPRAKT